MASGKSKSQTFPNGERKTMPYGQKQAPKAMRKKGRVLLSDCTDFELQVYSNIHR